MANPILLWQIYETFSWSQQDAPVVAPTWGFQCSLPMGAIGYRRPRNDLGFTVLARERVFRYVSLDGFRPFQAVNGSF